MRKLTETEEWALKVLRKHGSYCPGNTAILILDQKDFTDTLDRLVKRKHVTVEMTDDGPRYHAL